MYRENRKIIGFWYIISFAIIAVGVIAGTLYYSFNFLGGADIKNYLDGYLNSLRNGMEFNLLIKASLKSYMLIFIGIALSALFKFGPFISAFLLIRKGFVSAFTTAAMMDVYGIGGLLLSLSSIMQITVIIPLLSLFSAMAVFSSKNKSDFERHDKIIYIIFCIVVFTTFCACAILEAFLTTTFMKWVAFKVT